jgi:hypothetical protein
MKNKYKERWRLDKFSGGGNHDIHLKTMMKTTKSSA